MPSEPDEALLLDHPEAVTAPPGGDGLVHICCCDEDLALCGKDVSGLPVTDDSDPDPLCVVCEAVMAGGMPCPAADCPRGS